MISIIIPTLNEESRIKEIFQNLKTLEGLFEVIFVDGNSEDKTRQVIQECIKIYKFPARIFTTKKAQRAFQMNIGAKKAKGGYLLFLHADTALPSNALQKIQSSSFNGGSFKLSLDNHLSSKLISLFANLRSDLTHIYYGDQGIFVKKEIFEKIQGYDEVDLMEDHLFSRKLRREENVRLIDQSVISSPRRFERNGYIKKILMYRFIRTLFYFNVPIKNIARIYQSLKKGI